MIILTATFTFSNGQTYDVMLNNMLSLESSITDRKDHSLPSWGIISNGGNIKMVDYNDEIRALASELELNKEVNVKIYLKNTILNTSSIVGDFFVNKWQYDDDNKNVNATLDDGLPKMQNINITPIKKDAKNGGTTTGKSIYINLRTQTIANGFDMLSFDALDNKTQKHLENFVIYLAYIEEKTLWRAWQEFCEALQLYIFKNNYGKIVCVYKEGE